jgi:hypothetical protein
MKKKKERNKEQKKEREKEKRKKERKSKAVVSLHSFATLVCDNACVQAHVSSMI